MPEEQGPRPQQDMFASEGEGIASDAEKVRRPLSQLKSGRSLERLRDRIQLTARELKRLREENAALHRQLEELQTSGLGMIEGTPVVFTESASVLRTRVEGFIETIDQYLERSAEPERRDPS